MDMQQRLDTNNRLNSVIRRLDAYYAAEEAILGGAQEYSVGTRRLRRGDLNVVRQEIKELEQKRNELECALAQGSTKRKAFRVVPRDL